MVLARSSSRLSGRSSSSSSSLSSSATSSVVDGGSIIITVLPAGVCGPCPRMAAYPLLLMSSPRAAA